MLFNFSLNSYPGDSLIGIFFAYIEFCQQKIISKTALITKKNKYKKTFTRIHKF